MNVTVFFCFFYMDPYSCQKLAQKKLLVLRKPDAAVSVSQRWTPIRRVIRKEDDEPESHQHGHLRRGSGVPRPRGVAR